MHVHTADVQTGVALTLRIGLSSLYTQVTKNPLRTIDSLAGYCQRPLRLYTLHRMSTRRWESPQYRITTS